MLGKLALRNVKRHLGSYVIYFVTVALSVSMMFAINNMAFNYELGSMMAAIRLVRMALNIVTAVVAVIVAFVIGYASTYLLRLRKREFGVYMTLGMSRGDILKMYVVETLVIAGLSLGAGILLGLLVYQAIMAMAVNINDLPYTPHSYSWQGFALTGGIVVLIYLASTLFSLYRLRRVNVLELLKSDTKSKREPRYADEWLTCAIVQLIILVASTVLVCVLSPISNDSKIDLAYPIVALYVTVAVSLFVFHLAGAKGILPRLLKNEKLKGKGVNVFVLRTLSSRLTSSSIMFAFMALLLALSFLLANLSSTAAIGNGYEYKSLYDVSVETYEESKDERARSLDYAESVFNEHNEITDKVVIRKYFCSECSAIVSGIGQLNALLVNMGKAPVSLEDGTYVALCQENDSKHDLPAITIDGKGYEFAGYIVMPREFSNLSVHIIPDRALESETMRYSDSIGWYRLADPKQNAIPMWNELDAAYGFHLNYTRYDFLRAKSSSTSWTVCCLFLSVTFVLLTMAVLGLKLMNDVMDARTDYAMLRRLGVDEKGIRRTLFRLILLYCLIPFAVPFIMSVPIMLMCVVLGGMGYMEPLRWEIAVACSLNALLLTAIYACYLLAAYYVSKRLIGA